MKKLAAYVVGIGGLIGAPAFAADMAIKAPPPAPVPIFSWTGCYAGVNGGYAWNSGKFHYDDANLPRPDPINFADPFNVSAPTPDTRGNGGMGGLGAGCNWQTQQWVFGIEGDVDVGHLAKSQTTSVTVPPGEIALGTVFIFGAGSFATAHESTEINWLSTVRGRVGFAVLDRLLLFATGGLAIGQAHSDGSVFASLPNGSTSALWSGSNSVVKAGFVVGGGAEWAFADRWTAKAEYLYYDLGSVSHPLPCVSGFASAFLSTCGNGLFSTLGNAVSPLHVNFVRVGINYKFN